MSINDTVSLHTGNMPIAMTIDIRQAVASEMALMRSIDDDASRLYAENGFTIDFQPDHPFVAAEEQRWRLAAEEGRAFVAWSNGQPVGFASLETLDGNGYLDQLSVRMEAMRRGYGEALLVAAVGWTSSRGLDELWLTTYSHLSWNAGFYRRHGFVEVPATLCGPEIRFRLDEQRACLPAPEFRIAMKLRINAAT